MKLADIEKKVDALEDADAEIENEIAALNDTGELSYRGEEFQNSGRIRLALKCFLRAGKLYHVDDFISAAKIFVDVLSDGYAALYLYRYAIRGRSKSVAVTVTPEEQLLRKLFGEEELPVEWQYPDTFYLEALRGQAEIFRFGIGGVPADGRKAIKYCKRIIEIIFGTLDIHSLDDAEKFKRIRADGERGHQYAVRALADIANMYGYGEAGIRPDLNKSENFYELALYLDHEYLIDKNYRSWWHNECEREFD